MDSNDSSLGKELTICFACTIFIAHLTRFLFLSTYEALFPNAWRKLTYYSQKTPALPEKVFSF